MDGVLTRVEIEPAEPGGLLVRWEPASGADLAIGIGPTQDPATHTTLLQASGDAGSARLTDVPSGRHYISVSRDGSTLVAAERRLPFAGTLNFRDLGGYPTASGRHTRWGLLYRSSSLHKLTAEDLVAFDALGVRAIFDLRREDERDRDPGPRPSHSLPMPTRYADGAPDLSVLRERVDGERWLHEEYRTMVTDGGPIFGRLLTTLAEADGTPAVFHCAGGKDRTGMSAALLLSWLGVDRETVLDDYELTARYLSAKDTPAVVESMVEFGIGRAAAEGLLSTPRWALAEALDLIDSDHGGVEAYLRGPAGLHHQALDDLQNRFLS